MLVTIHPGFFGNIFESSILPVMIKMIFRQFIGLLAATETFEPGTAADIKVNITVLIIIQEGSTSTHRFNNIGQFVIPYGMNEIKAYLFPDFLKIITGCGRYTRSETLL